MTERRYTDDETAAILGRVADLSTDAKDGLSIEELERVAKEAGLDESKVRQAARDIAGSGPRAAAAPQSIVTAKRVHHEIEIPGELDDDARAAVFEVVRKHLPSMQHSGSGRLMTFHAPSGTLNVTVSSARGHTRVVVDFDRKSEPAAYGTMAALVGMTALPIVGLSVGASLGDAAGIAAGLAVAACAAFGTWRLTRRVRRRSDRILADAFHAIEAVVVERARSDGAASDAGVDSALEVARAHQGLAAAGDATPTLVHVEVEEAADVELKAK